MTLTEHLEELRWCVLKSILAVALAAAAKPATGPKSNRYQCYRSVFCRNQSRSRGGGAFFVPGYLLPDLALYRAGFVEPGKKLDSAVCILRHVLFCRGRVFLLSIRFAGCV